MKTIFMETKIMATKYNFLNLPFVLLSNSITFILTLLILNISATNPTTAPKYSSVIKTVTKLNFISLILVFLSKNAGKPTANNITIAA